MNTITVNGVTYNYEEYMASQNATKKNVNADYISKDTFLKLLVTQMQYQDPLDPMDNGEYLSQLAQFSALEQMTVDSLTIALKITVCFLTIDRPISHTSPSSLSQ